MDRVIGAYHGKSPGPLVILIGAMHGNEPAGVEAIKMLFRELALEPFHNKDFEVNGSILGLIGNVAAFDKGVRFIDRDMNRSWLNEYISCEHSERPFHEVNEICEVLYEIKNFVLQVNPTEIIVLDLHTTSSYGGIFTITSEEPKSLTLAQNLHAPVVKGILKGLQGTSIHFFRGTNMGLQTTAITFEAGHHDDILSPGRAYAAIVNCLKSVGSVKHEDVENRHDKILIEFSKNLPKVTNLIFKFDIPKAGDFKMLPGFVSFDKIQKGQSLAHLDSELITAPYDGRILMPLYQTQGEEGFFIVEG